MIAIIAARSINNVIGKDGRIPWNIKGEKQQFKELTTGSIVVMGRKTYEEIGFPLPNRKTIVVSRTKSFEGENLFTAASVKEAVQKTSQLDSTADIYFAGGYGIYKEAIPLVDVMYITEVQLFVEGGNVFFPDFDDDAFEKSVGETAGEDIKYTRTIYTRKKKRE